MCYNLKTMNFMMTDEEFIDYSMSMHYLTPDQKLIYLKELVNSMQKDYVKPRFIVTSEEELNQKLEEGMKSAEEGKCLSNEEVFKRIREKYGLTHLDFKDYNNTKESQMNEIIKAMKERRSIRKFKSEMPAKADLEQIVEAGLYAASGMGKQATKIIVVTDKKLRDKIMEMNRKVGGWDDGFDPFYGAPAMIIVLGELHNGNRVYDGSLVIGNLMLAAHSLGLGSIWIHRAKQEFESDEGKEILKQLGVEGEWEGIGHCAVGYMDCELPPPPARKEGRVVWA